MADTNFFVILLHVLIQFIVLAGDDLDKATHERIQMRVVKLSQEMTLQQQELQELEQGAQEQSAFAALQQWQFWATAGLLFLLLGLCCWWLRKKNHWLGQEWKIGELQQMLKNLTQHMQLSDEEMDEVVCEVIQKGVGHLIQAMIQWLLQELEKSTQGQSAYSWRALLFAALQQWQFWATAGILVLLLGLCRWCVRKRNRWVRQQWRRELQQN